MLLSLVAAGLALYRLLDADARIDAVTIALVALAAIPWLTATIESVGFPGGSLKLRRIESTQLQQAGEIETLGFLLTMVASRYERGHLSKLAAQAPFPYSQDGTTTYFFRELRSLRDRGLLEVKGGKAINDLPQSGDMNDHLAITETGRRYLAMLAEFEHPGHPMPRDLDE